MEDILRFSLIIIVCSWGLVVSVSSVMTQSSVRLIAFPDTKNRIKYSNKANDSVVLIKLANISGCFAGGTVPKVNAVLGIVAAAPCRSLCR
jgi:hypothetical protein